MSGFNLIYGIAAIANSHVFTANAHYAFGDLRTWDWITLLIGVLQLLAAAGVAAGNQQARWFGVAVLGLNAIDQMFFIPAYPFGSLTIIAVDVVALYGLCAYGSRANLQAKPAASADGVLGYSQVLACWTAPDLRARTDRIPVSSSMAAGHTGRLWVNAAGSPAGPPLNDRLVLAYEVTAAVISTVTLGIMLLCLGAPGGGCLTGGGSPTGKRHGPLSTLSGPGASGRGASRGREQRMPVTRGGRR